MNILLIAHERNLGGASKSLVTLASELQGRGNKVTVVVPFRSGQVYKKLKELQVPVYKIFFGWWMMPSYWNLLLKTAFRILHMTEKIPVVRIGRIIRKENIQVIHSNSSVIDVGAFAAKKMGLPHVWHFREFGDADYQLEYLKGRKESCRFITESKSKVIFISKNLRNYYKEEIPDNISKVIYNGISEEFLLQKDFVKKESKVIFLISGNLHRNKGQNVALRAGKVLRDEGITNFEIWVAGQASAISDSKKYEAELREFAENNLGDSCKFLGFVSNMREIRQKADVELVCSSREAFGRVTVEAMMASNPVIGSDSGANPELIEENKNGFLFEEGNEKQLAEKMKIYLEQAELIQKMGAYAFQYASQKFPSSENTKQIEKLYKELVYDNK